MPIFRNKKGEVKIKDDEKTRPIKREKNTSSMMFDEDSNTLTTPVPAASDEGKTQVNFGHRAPHITEIPPDTSNAMADPVIGWLVIVQGAGQGHALKLGYGQNSVGRSDSERVCINFGDNEISREQHCIITYDPRGRKYYISNGNGTNLAYLNDAPVMAPTELTGSELISLGQTTCRFIPLCGKDFDWQDFDKKT